VTHPVRRLLLIGAVTALAATACSTSDSLATVNGTEITRDDLLRLRPSYDDAPSVDSERMRDDLTALIVLQAVQDSASEQFGLVFTEEQIDERLANPPARYATLLTGASAEDDLGEYAIRADALNTLLRDAVVPNLLDLDPARVEPLLESSPEEFAKVCVRHIAVATEEEAEAVMDRLAGGEDFLDLVEEVSVDTSPGGLVSSDGTCPISIASAGVEFSSVAATAALNEPVGPVEANGQWHVILVEERLLPASAQEFIDDPLEWLDGSFVTSLYSEWFNAAVQAAEIEVSPTVGAWAGAANGITPPGE
jgi:parvulin-like peptidyl-prolyl isomerase